MKYINIITLSGLVLSCAGGNQTSQKNCFQGNAKTSSSISTTYTEEKQNKPLFVMLDNLIEYTGSLTNNSMNINESINPSTGSEQNLSSIQSGIVDNTKAIKNNKKQNQVKNIKRLNKTRISNLNTLLENRHKKISRFNSIYSPLHRNTDEVQYPFSLKTAKKIISVIRENIKNILSDEDSVSYTDTCEDIKKVLLEEKKSNFALPHYITYICIKNIKSWLNRNCKLKKNTTSGILSLSLSHFVNLIGMNTSVVHDSEGYAKMKNETLGSVIEYNSSFIYKVTKINNEMLKPDNATFSIPSHFNSCFGAKFAEEFINKLNSTVESDFDIIHNELQQIVGSDINYNYDNALLNHLRSSIQIKKESLTSPAELSYYRFMPKEDLLMWLYHNIYIQYLYPAMPSQILGKNMEYLNKSRQKYLNPKKSEPLLRETNIKSIFRYLKNHYCNLIPNPIEFRFIDDEDDIDLSENSSNQNTLFICGDEIHYSLIYDNRVDKYLYRIDSTLDNLSPEHFIKKNKEILEGKNYDYIVNNGVFQQTDGYNCMIFTFLNLLEICKIEKKEGFIKYIKEVSNDKNSSISCEYGPNVITTASLPGECYTYIQSMKRIKNYLGNNNLDDKYLEENVLSKNVGGYTRSNGKLLNAKLDFERLKWKALLLCMNETEDKSIYNMKNLINIYSDHQFKG